MAGSLTNSTFHQQLNQRSQNTFSNSVEFVSGTPTDLATNPKRVWIDQTTNQFRFTTDGDEIVTVGDFVPITPPESPVVTSGIGYNVKDYGAIGNGVTNDTAAVISAIADVQAHGGGTLIFPIGQYKLSTWATQTITTPFAIVGEEGTVLTGANVAGVDFIKINANISVRDITIEKFEDIFDFSGTTTLLDYAKFYNVCMRDYLRAGLTWDALSPDNAGFKFCMVNGCQFYNGKYGIYCQTPTINHMEILGCIVDGMYERGFYLGNNNATWADTRRNIKIHHNTVKNIISPSTNRLAPVNGILVYGKYIQITDNYVENIDTDSITDNEGIYIKCRYSIVQRNIMYNGGTAEGFINIKGNLRIIGSGQPQGYATIVSHNFLYSNRPGLDTYGVKLQCEETKVENNYFEGFTVPIYMGSEASYNIEIRANKILYTKGYAAVSIAGAGSRIVCDNNMIYDVGSESSSQPSGIKITNTAGGDITVSNNFIDNVRDLGNSPVGILVKPGSNITNLVIRDNSVSNTKIGLSFNTNAVDGIWVRGNSFYNNVTTSVVYSVSPVAYQIENNRPALPLPPDIVPSTIGGMQLWLDATQLTPVADGTAVGTMSDYSGNLRHATQATGTLQPLYKTGANGINNKPVLLFDGIDDLLKTPAFTAQPQPFTMYFVGSIETTGYIMDGLDNKNFDGTTASPPTPGRRIQLRNSGSGLYANAGIGLFGQSADTNSHIIKVIFNVAASTIKVNGNSAVVGDAGNNYIGGLTLGGLYSGSNWAKGKVGEVIVYNTVLTNLQQKQVEQYLQNKWGISF